MPIGYTANGQPIFCVGNYKYFIKVIIKKKNMLNKLHTVLYSQQINNTFIKLLQII